jgi:peptidoglycan/LPS O-acetylase OafA/YrhL
MRQTARHNAFLRRLRDTPGKRWAWAVGSAVPLVGVPVLVKHGLSRRTLTPTVFGVTALGAASFVLAVTVPVILPSGPFTPRRGDAGVAASVALAAAAFAVGHRAGQERDAREARTWLALEE